MPNEIHSYTELQQQIHEDLRNQHPEWIEPKRQLPHVRLLRVAPGGTTRPCPAVDGYSTTQIISYGLRGQRA